MRLFVLVSDAFGGRGGIAKFNRDLLRALSGHPASRGVTALPRLVPDPPGRLPPGLDYRRESAGGAARYLWAVTRELALGGPYDGVVCGHIHLLPVAYLAARRWGVPLVLVVHGIEAWQPTGRRPVDRLAGGVDHVVAVSATTLERYTAWSRLPADRGWVIPNCVDPTRYGPGPKRRDLLARYGLEGSRVLLTLGRLPGTERYKGVDEVLGVFPELVREYPDLEYLVIGEGDDRPRLERKARELGLAGRIVFAGRVAEEEKADHYRLADAFVMPGRGEGFGIVYLEALASGVPVVASEADGSRDAVLGGELGEVVDPDDPADIVRGIRLALRRPTGEVPAGLDRFSRERFDERWRALTDTVFGVGSADDAP